MRKVVALAGGTGSAKLVRGLHHVSGIELSIIGNVGDNFWWHGLYVCPDLDTIMYALAGWLDVERGWGLRGETFRSLRQLARVGAPTWFRTGDADLAIHLLRTTRLFAGDDLSEVTDHLRRAVGVAEPLYPASDDEVQTRIRTERGWMHLQEYWVRWGARPQVHGVSYDGGSAARANPRAIRALDAADTVIISPANPITSIGPILAIPELRAALRKRRPHVIGVSPLVAGAPVSGPAGRLLRSLGMSVRPSSVARLHRDVLGTFLLDPRDRQEVGKVRELGVGAEIEDILMPDAASERRLAHAILALTR